MSDQYDLAWLAGLWDGEGSVGVTAGKSTGTTIYIPVIQINMTHRTIRASRKEREALARGRAVEAEVARTVETMSLFDFEESGAV